MSSIVDNFLRATPEANSKGFVNAAEKGRKAYLEAAYRLIALSKQVGDDATKMLRAAGAKESDIRNARYVQRVYDGLVTPGFVGEDWFEQVRYTEAYAIVRALAKVKAEKMRDAGVFKMSAASGWAEYEAMAETGLTKAERLKLAESVTPKPAAKAEAPKAETAKPAAPAAKSEKEETATPPAEETPKVAEIAKPVNPLAELEEKVATVEKIALAIVAKADDVTMERVQKALVSLNRAVSAAIEVKVKAAKAKAA